jgi:hypothetical protein
MEDPQVASTTSNEVSLKEDRPVCNNLTSSNKLEYTITVLSYIPVILTFIMCSTL